MRRRLLQVGEGGSVEGWMSCNVRGGNVAESKSPGIRRDFFMRCDGHPL